MGSKNITPQAIIDRLLDSMENLAAMPFEGVPNLSDEETKIVIEADKAALAFKKYVPLFKAAPRMLQTCRDMKRFLNAELHIFPRDSGLEALIADLDAVINDANGK